MVFRYGETGVVGEVRGEMRFGVGVGIGGRGRGACVLEKGDTLRDRGC